MAKGIKGITVEIGGNTGPLDKALGDVNKKSRSLQVELRQVEKLLKFDPGNTELLAQKQELLSKSVSNTEEKLNALKAAQSQVQAQFENGDIGEEQYRSFQREIIKTEQELDNIKNTLQSTTQNIESIGDSLTDASKFQKDYTESVKMSTEELEKQKEALLDTAKNVGTGMLAIGAGALAGATYATKLSTDFDKAFNTLITKTGASKDEFDGLNESMENVYANNFGDSIEDVAQSMATVKVNTNLMGKELEVATERALLLRDTFEFDVNESTRSAKMLMDQFGVSSDEAYNLIAQGAQNGLDKNGDLLDTINEYSVHFKQLGLTSEDMFNMLVNGAEDGTFSVDKLGDAVKEFGIRVKDGTADNAFEKLGFDVDELTTRFGQGGDAATTAMLDVTNALFDLDDPIQQNLLGVELFGTQWEDLGVKGVTALMDTHGEINKTKSALEDINNQKYDDLGSALTGLGRIISVDVVKPLGEELKPIVEESIGYIQNNLPSINGLLSEVLTVVSELISFVVSNGPTIISVITGVVTSLGILKGILIAEKIFLFVQGIMALEGGLKLASIATALFNSAWLANPLVWIGGLIAGIVVGIITLLNTNEDFRNSVLEIWESIKQAAETCWGAICTFFTETIPEAWQSALDLFSQAPEFFSDVWTQVTDTFTTWGDNVTNFFTSTIPGWIDSIGEWFNQLPEKIGFAIGEALAKIVNWGSETWNYLVTNVPIWIENVSTYFSELPNKIWTWLSNAIQKVSTWGSETYNKAKDAASKTINGIITYFSELPSKIWTWLLDSINKMVQWSTQMVTKGKDAAKKTGDAIVNGFKSIPGKVADIGKGIVEGIWNGITGMTGWITSKISGFCTGIVNGFKSALKINSPSKIMRDIVGTGIVEGIVDGMMLNEDQVKSATEKLSKVITSEIKKIQSDSDKEINLLNIKIDELKEEEKNKLNDLKYKDEDILKNLKYEEEDALDNLKLEKENKLNSIKDENRKKAIQKEYEEKEKALKREFDAKETALKRDSDLVEESIKKEYDLKEKSLKDKIDLIKEETKTKIDELKLTEKAIEEQLKKELEERKDFIKEVNDLAKELVDSLKAKYQEEYKAQEDSIKNQISNLDKWKEESIKRINSVYDAKIKAIDDELKALDEAQKQKDRDEIDKEELDNIEKIKTAMEFEHDENNKEQLQKELDKLINERNKRLELQKIEDKKEELRKQKEDLEAKKKNELDNINDIYTNEKEMYETRLEESKKFYEQQIESAKLQAEAEKLIMDKNQKDIVELLKSYSKDYEIAGMTLGEKLVDGFKPAIASIKDMIDSITADLSSARDEALGARSLYPSSVNNSRSINTNNNTNNYNVNVSGHSGGFEKAIEKGFRDLAFIIS